MPYIRRGRALGADEVLTEQEFRTSALTELRAINTRTAAAVKKEEFQKWVQIGVTAAIPVFGAMWSILAKYIRKD